MSIADSVSIGVDATSGHKAFTLAALDNELRLVLLTEAELDEALDFLREQPRATVALNAPSHVSTGVVRRRLERDGSGPHALRGAGIREAESNLHALGIAVGGTPSTEALCPAWVQSGFELYRRLSHLGYRAYPNDEAPRQWLETHPHAGFCVLLGRSPLPKPTLEGRLQRALALHERGLRIPDPMTFLEEITRHRVLNGLIPMEMVPQPCELDALVAAFTASLALSKPQDVTRLGNKQEGYIVLPAAELKIKYEA